MARKTPRPEATHTMILTPAKERCEQCDKLFWVAYHGHRTVTTLSGVWELTLVIRQCSNPICPLYHVRYRPEEEGYWALPHGEFGLDVIALIGSWRFREHRSVPEMHQALQARGLSIAERSVTYLMQRYEELVTLHVTDQERIKAQLQKQGQVILALDGLKPDVGHEVLWVVRDCLSQEILLARPLLSQTQGDITSLLRGASSSCSKNWRCQSKVSSPMGKKRSAVPSRLSSPRCLINSASFIILKMPLIPSMKPIGMPKRN